MASTAFVLGVLDTAGIVAVWHVFLLALLLGVGTAIENPVRQSFVSEMVGPDDLPNAVGLNSASFNVARIVGPAVAGLLIVWVGTGPVFLVNALTFVAVVVALSRMRVADLHPDAAAAARERAAARGCALRRPPSRPAVRTRRRRFVGMFGLNFQMTTALMATEVYGKGARGVRRARLDHGGRVAHRGAAGRAARRPRLRLVTGAAVVFGASRCSPA
jgi:MFS family permease